MKHLLYKKEGTGAGMTEPGFADFAPGPGKLYVPGEHKSLKASLLRLYFWALTGGKARLYYIRSEEDRIIHTSYVLGKCMKFPYLNRGDYQIGPCHTAPEFRGRGLYGKMLNHITGNGRYQDACFYMSVSETNTPSIRGIEKAGFRHVGYVRKTKILKRFYRSEDVS